MRSQYAHLVAQRQHGVAVRQNLQVAAPHPADDRAIAFAQAQIAQPAPGHCRIGDEDAAFVIDAHVKFQVIVQRMSQHGSHAL